ncbi:unnamed protein product [Coffea canephora]|uniref:Uncharacterized protein n=1 Tax=Coffea canephora TaxID=49390 RepID=A0A068ULX6_COFCA|nr:unnamed protein product [Coffea canephora]
MHHENVGSPVDGTSGTEYGAAAAAAAAAGKCCSGSVFGPAPSRLEVEKAMTDLQRFLHGEEAKSNFHWLQPIVYPSDSRMLQSPGYRRIKDAFGMLQREPSVQEIDVWYSWFEDSAETETSRPSRNRLGLGRDDTATIRDRDTRLAEKSAETSPRRVVTVESPRVTPSHPESRLLNSWPSCSSLLLIGIPRWKLPG